MSTPAPLVRVRPAMYEEFYRFGQPPFTLSPDPRFLYRSASHEEALTLLLQSVRRKDGVIILTGDIGTGKTTLCRALLQQLDVNTFSSLVLNPFLSVEELLRNVLVDFGVVSREVVRNGRISGASQQELVRTLHDFVVSLAAIRGSAVLVIDEAQHLAPEVLEELHALSSFGTSESKLLQIVLVGQLNLMDVLVAAPPGQISGRPAITAMLKPLTRVEVEAYIAHRLRVARGAEAVSFEAEAIDLVHGISQGVPRVINLVCDRSLMYGADLHANVVTPALVEQAAGTLGLAVPTGAAAARAARLRRWGLAAAGVLLAATIVILAPLHRLVDATPPPGPAPPVLRTAEPLVPIEPPPP